MTNLGPQFQTKDWNPFIGASNALNTATVYGDYYKRALAQSIVHNKNVQNHVNSQQPQRQRPTPENTGAPTPGYLKRGAINPSTTGAPMPGTLKNNASTKSTPSVPVKPKGAKPTAPGTRPKPPKKK
ncbi:hypothetical protein UFOVP1033_142 [uncultured Caudovirales phage]|uniref:Uncharacterized protein n=1 Tax=uncultured Caudovirales phage TaxID=2100421 RepID=A0A6J5SZY7_9CAUD|nr:hypothetical protein UFOVP1033_142 [uncultured Caudovirales phage]CAB4221038.1 hypothetical protein UFOVP1631_142 [uncultured Caudovirales phage]